MQNFNRAVQASDIEEPLPDWIANWYSWIPSNRKQNELMLKMLTNNIPPEKFFTSTRLLCAYIFFGMLPKKFLETVFQTHIINKSTNLH